MGLPLFCFFIFQLILSDFASLGFAEDSLPVIGSIDGARHLGVFTPQGKQEERESGETLAVGDEVRTEAGVSATIRYPEGGVFVLGQKSGFRVSESPHSANAAELRFGMVRGIIGKFRRGGAKQGEAKKPLRFLIRAKAAVIGVRGTDFLISAEEGVEASKVYTLEGGVEVAKTEEKLAAGEATPVKTGEFVQATPEAIAPPQKFNPEELAQSLAKEQPGLSVTPLSAPAPLPSPEPPPAPPALEEGPQAEWLHFEVGVVGDQLPRPGMGKASELESTGGGPTVHWSPFFYLFGTRWLHLRPRAGVSLFNSPPELLGNFTGLDFRVAIGARLFDSLWVDLGPIVYRFGQNGFGTGGGVNLAWQFKTKWFGVIEKIYVGGADIDLPRPSYLVEEGELNKIAELRFGVGIGF